MDGFKPSQRKIIYTALKRNINSQDGKDMLNELKTVCDCLKLVGTYTEHL